MVLTGLKITRDKHRLSDSWSHGEICSSYLWSSPLVTILCALMKSGWLTVIGSSEPVDLFAPKGSQIFQTFWVFDFDMICAVPPLEPAGKSFLAPSPDWLLSWLDFHPFLFPGMVIRGMDTDNNDPPLGSSSAVVSFVWCIEAVRHAGHWCDVWG